jgi:ATP-dependent Clp protease ATP-binding subunit ClpA
LRLTDSKGRSVDFKNTIIIMTSNIGSQILLENVKDSGEITESTEKAVMDSLHAVMIIIVFLKSTLRPLESVKRPSSKI